MAITRVAYLGPEGTYTHQAAIQQFGDTAELIPQKSIKDCFSIVEDGEAHYSVVPFENSTNGQVALTYDLLREWFFLRPSTTITVAYEQFVAIHHCVLSHAKDIKDVKKIYTHPQAWGQVTNWLHQYPDLEKIDSSSTSKAAEVASREDGTYAAIASSYASKVHNIPILFENIENIKDNTTRFLVLTSKKGKTESGEVLGQQLPEKFVTLVAFTVEHDNPGALVNALGTLTEHGISMTSITSRPSTTQPWHYVFFIEFWTEKDSLNSVMIDFEAKCLTTHVLGTFPRSERYYGEP